MRSPRLDIAAVAKRSTICLFDESWHQGVVGLVASRIKEKFHRPTIAFARAGEAELRGSGRSIEGVHLRDTLDLVTKVAPTMIKRFGGHAMAAGLTLAAEQYDDFAAAFEDATTRLLRPFDLRTHHRHRRRARAGEFTFALVDACDQHVWGQGFPAPLFDQEFDVVEQRLVKDRHLKLTLEIDGRRLNGIFFRRTEPLPRRARLAYRPAIDDYQGRRRLTLFIEHCESSG